LKTNIPQNTELSYQEVVAPLLEVITPKSFIGFGSGPRIIACNKRILSIKYIYKKQLIKNECNKKIISSPSHAKQME
jgi:hypothetical protein